MAISGLVKSGSASRPTKTKMSTTAAMPVRATAVMPTSMATSRSCRRRMAAGVLAARPTGWVRAVTGSISWFSRGAAAAGSGLRRAT